MRLPTEFKPLLRELKRLPRLLAVELAIALALLVGLGVLSYHNLQRQAVAADWVAHTYQVRGGGAKGVFERAGRGKRATRVSRLGHGRVPHAVQSGDPRASRST